MASPLVQVSTTERKCWGRNLSEFIGILQTNDQEFKADEYSELKILSKRKNKRIDELLFYTLFLISIAIRYYSRGDILIKIFIPLKFRIFIGYSFTQRFTLLDQNPELLLNPKFEKLNIKLNV